MSITVQLLEEAIEARRKKRDELIAFMQSTPIIKVIELRQRAVPFVERIQAGKMSPEDSAELSRLAKEEKKLMSDAKKQSDPKLFHQRIELDSEISELQLDLALLKVRKRL
jgi:hypothetical protein